MSPGDTLLLFTDGITDAMDEHGERFGTAGLHNCLCHSFDISPQRVCDRLIDLIMEHQHRVAQYDDATVVAARSA